MGNSHCICADRLRYEFQCLERGAIDGHAGSDRDVAQYDARSPQDAFVKHSYRTERRQYFFDWRSAASAFRQRPARSGAGTDGNQQHGAGRRDPAAE